MHKKIIALISLMLLLAVVWVVPQKTSEVKGIFTTTTVKQVQVTVTSANLRTGASTSHSKISALTKGSIVDVMGKIGDWYVVKTSGDTVGCLNSSTVKPYTAPSPTPTPTPVPAPTDVSSMQTEMLGYINAARAENGAAPLVLDQALCNGAYLKSKDMVDNNYFDHNSPTYGSPFEMMQKLGISFSWAGENLAKHTSIKAAHDGLMNSPGHRANILKPEYKKLGLGIVKDGQYLYITQWFTD
ncbi:MAG: CAP domain-containing protein [Methylocystaceae bacterium]